MHSTLLTVHDVAQYLGVPVATLYAWRHRGLGPRAAKVGRHLRYRQDDVDRWVDEQMFADYLEPTAGPRRAGQSPDQSRLALTNRRDRGTR